MLRLLDRYILGQLLRVLALTCAVLVTVIAFGATMKPVTGDAMLTAGEALRYMLLAVVPMLQFALPFAAGFASTIVLHRMASDNEILAASVSGMSYRRILMPVIALGIVIGLVMVLLTQQAIPKFWRMMERAVAADVTRLFQASIDRGTPFQIGNLQIAADRMVVQRRPSDTDAQTRLILRRVAAAELDEKGRIETEVTAWEAVVDIHRVTASDGEQTLLKLVMSEAVAFDPAGGELVYFPQFEPSRAILVPSVFQDQLRARTRGALLRMREEPQRHSRVAEATSRLGEAIRRDALWKAIDEQIAEHGELHLRQSAPSRRRYIIRAGGINGGVFIPRGDRPVEVVQFDGQRAQRRMAAEHVAIQQSSGGPLTAPTFELLMRSVEVRDLQMAASGGDAEAGGIVNRRESIRDSNLSLPDFGEIARDEVTIAALLEEALLHAPGGDVQHAAKVLQTRLDDLDREITARLLARYAQSAMAGLLLLLGAAFAMLLRGSLPLVIYIWAFAPSVLGLIMVSGGDKMIRDDKIIGGLLTMWSGSAGLLLLFFVVYWKLSRN